MRRTSAAWLCTTILLYTFNLSAQTEPVKSDSTHQNIPDSLVEKQGGQIQRTADTLRYLPPSDLLSLPPISDTVDSESRLTQNPTSALFRSLLVPGWGQIVNKSYLKAGLYGGLQLYFASRAIHHARDAHDLYRSWESEADSNITVKNGIYDSYLVSADARNAHRWYFGITTMISMFDAYVDAHLSGRPRVRRERAAPRRNELSIDIETSPSTRGLMLVARF